MAAAGRYPDFIIIGAMKCATSTLHDQLAAQPGVFMSDPKEPCYFSDDEIHARGVGWYTNLFTAAAPSDICGESSTHYTKQPTHPDTVQRMADELPEHARFIYIMRHPVDRLVSQYMHEWTQRTIGVSLDDAVDQYPMLMNYSRYAMQLEPYLEAFGRDRILPVFFERLTKSPQTALTEVGCFIGLSAAPVWQHDLHQRNASADRLRASPWRDAVANFPGVTTLRRTLVPQRLRDWVKSWWTMSARPTLSPDTRRWLEDRFDQDLQQLGEWLGLNLSCATFAEVAATTQPRWAAAEVPS